GAGASAGRGGQSGTVAFGGGANSLGGRAGGASGGAANLGGSNQNAGGYAVGGAPTGGALPTGGTSAAGATNNVDPASGINGRVVVTVASTTSGAEARASFYDRPVRVDAFAPFPPTLHELVLQQGGCVLTKAALRACNPPCGTNQYCGLGDVCTPAAQPQSAGTITVTGPVSTVSLSATNSAYSPQSIPVANITPNDLISVSAAGGAVPAFSLSSLGVTTAAIGLPGNASTFQLVDGQDKVLTWTPTSQGTVQLLLNSGWHGAPPAATLVCEAPASAGRLVVPRAIVELYPTESGGAGLLSHTSTVSLLQRQRVNLGGNVLELLVIGYRGVIQPLH
ncbi:MAG TPA: hypothetical protein VIV60_28800, partial [Polyangiaceae bacterium]